MGILILILYTAQPSVSLVGVVLCVCHVDEMAGGADGTPMSRAEHCHATRAEPYKVHVPLNAHRYLMLNLRGGMREGHLTGGEAVEFNHAYPYDRSPHVHAQYPPASAVLVYVTQRSNVTSVAPSYPWYSSQHTVLAVSNVEVNHRTFTPVGSTHSLTVLEYTHTTEAKTRARVTEGGRKPSNSRLCLVSDLYIVNHILYIHVV